MSYQRIQTTDEVLNRIQDNIEDALASLVAITATSAGSRIVQLDTVDFILGGVGKSGAFFGGAPVPRQILGGTIVNNIAAGGTLRQLDTFAGGFYATDAATIRNDLYQLGEQVRRLSTGVRAGKLNLFT